MSRFIRVLVITTTVQLLLSCVKSSYEISSWSLGHVKEPNCLKCSCMGDAVDEGYRRSILELMSKKAYKITGSRSGYAFSYIVNQGKHATSDEDVDKMCQTRLFNQASGFHSFQGYGVNVTLKLNLKKLSSVTVYNILQKHDPFDMPESDARTYTQLTGAFRFSIVLTDGISFSLVTGCRFDGQTFWHLMSTKKTLSARLKTKVMKKIVSLGFDSTKAYIANFKNCPT